MPREQAWFFIELSRPGQPPISLALNDYLDLSVEDIRNTLVHLYVRKSDGSKEYLKGWWDICRFLSRPIPEVRR